MVTTTDFLNSFFNPDDIVRFRAFPDKKGETAPGHKLECECAKYNDVVPILQRYNAMGYCISFLPNSGGQTDAGITRINAQFIDIDEGSFEEQQKKLDAFPLPPSLIVKTRRSLHPYWLMDKSAKVERFRDIQRRLAKHFGADPMCVNESRAMRLPGFKHCKQDPPVEVECISYHPERRYSQDQLDEVLPELDPTPVEHKTGKEKGLDMIIRSCDFLKHCREDAKNLPEHDWYAMITNLAGFEGGTELIHELSAPYPGYNENATRKKINHFLESGTNPITCKTICEKGYKCPKYENGECPVKSPAAWAFRPMPTEALLEILNELPVTGDVIKDLQVAKQFVADYLFNQDAVVADVLINQAIKDHFKIKASFLKSLMQIYKEASKTYKSGNVSKRAKVDSDIPEWYEPTDYGLRFLPGVLAENMAEKYHVFYGAEQFNIYENGVYVECSELKVQHMVQEQMLVRETKMSQISDAQKQWRLKTLKDLREFNSNPYIINVRNGLYNVLEDTFTPHSPDFLSTVQLDVNYDKDADCPKFKKFLMDSMGGDLDQVNLIQEMLGYFLIPVNSAQKCFVIVGVAAAGKSVLLNVFNEILLGRKNVSNVSWQSLNEHFKTAELFGKLANIFADLPTKNIEDNGIFKALVGGDYLTVEKKYKEPFAFQSTARLLFSCNNIPRNYGDKSEGFYRRLIIIRFNHAVPQEKRDPDLLNKFRQEADGIFQFALEGLRRLMANNYRFSETQANLDELQKYREESDSVQSFIHDRCNLDASSSTGSTELFEAYKTYCEECGLKPYSQKTFVQQITAAFPEVTRDIDRIASRRVLNGIKLGEVLD